MILTALPLLHNTAKSKRRSRIHNSAGDAVDIQQLKRESTTSTSDVEDACSAAERVASKRVHEPATKYDKFSQVAPLCMAPRASLLGRRRCHLRVQEFARVAI